MAAIPLHLLSVAVAFSCLGETATAHEIDVAMAAPWQWNADPLVLVCLAASVLLYASGTAALWRSAGIGRGVRWRDAAAFGAGWLTLAAALASPLDALGTRLFSAHMVQHELLMVLAAPLLVSGRPLAVWTWGLPFAWRRAIGQLTRLRIVAACWRALTHPVVAWLIHALVVWLWHIPALFDAALRRSDVHAWQHFSFLFSALLFWWAVLGDNAGRARATATGWPIALVFTTMMHTGALGALLTLAPAPWYPAYVGPATALGRDPLQDQALGGLIMWLPGSLVYLWVAIMIGARWLTAHATAAKDWKKRDNF